MRARRSFQDESKARTLFPAMLWEGIGSDFASLRAAQSLVSETASALSALDETGVLRWWLAADSTERQTFSAGCDRLNMLLTEVIDAGFAGVPIADLTTTFADRIGALRQLVDAAKAVGIRPGATLQREVRASIADAVLNLHTARQGIPARDG